MLFTALHRVLGHEPGPLTDDHLNEAVAAGVAEADDLDWKQELPPEQDLARSDVVKDIAAFANSGGGLICFGMKEAQGRAVQRIDVGEVSETYERTLRRVAVSGVQPPIFNLGLYRFGSRTGRALALVVSASLDVPHLIYRNEYFGAPLRNHADTEWMREPQLERLYRLRLDERRNAGAALAGLYDEALAGRPVREQAWFIAVARPRLPLTPARRVSRDEARAIFQRADPAAFPRRSRHLLDDVDLTNPRPGLRRWIAANTAVEESWAAAGASVHDDGSVTIAAAIGGHRRETGTLPGNRFDSARAEAGVADLMGLVRAASAHHGTRDYEAQVGIEWLGTEPLVMHAVDTIGLIRNGSSLARFTPVTVSIRTDVDDATFLDQVADLATDVINQGGLQSLRVIKRPPP